MLSNKIIRLKNRETVLQLLDSYHKYVVYQVALPQGCQREGHVSCVLNQKMLLMKVKKEI